jgi:hypothetical protein
MSIIRRPFELLARAWSELPVYCSICSRPIAGQSVGRGESMAWCFRCQRVFPLLFFPVPGWVTGVLGVLTVNLFTL